MPFCVMKLTFFVSLRVASEAREREDVRQRPEREKMCVRGVCVYNQFISLARLL